MTGLEDMTAELAALAGLAQAQAWGAFLAFLRIGAAMALMPGFGEQTIPVRIRLALTIAFTLAVWPALPPPDPVAGAAVAVAGEVVAGLILGAGLRLVVMALQIAGTIAAQATSLSQLFGGTAGEPAPAAANLLVLAGLALAMAQGLHVKAASLFILSYDLLPAGRMAAAGDAAAWGVARVAQAFALAFALAMPFVLAATVFNVALGVINRAMPMLMVAFVGAPALTLGALALLAVAAPHLLWIWSGLLDRALAAPLDAAP